MPLFATNAKAVLWLLFCNRCKLIVSYFYELRKLVAGDFWGRVGGKDKPATLNAMRIFSEATKTKLQMN